jgi:hypothetical protein
VTTASSTTAGLTNSRRTSSGLTVEESRMWSYYESMILDRTVAVDIDDKVHDEDLAWTSFGDRAEGEIFGKLGFEFRRSINRVRFPSRQPSHPISSTKRITEQRYYLLFLSNMRIRSKKHKFWRILPMLCCWERRLRATSSAGSIERPLNPCIPRLTKRSVY